MAAELIVSQIPNQKLERVVLFIKILEDRVTYIEDDFLKQRFMSQEFADLLEDGLHQASRSLTDERKAYIANLLTTSLTDETLDHLVKKKLLSILNELNDAEVILLHYYGIRKTDQQLADEMSRQHPFIKVATSSYSSVQTETEEAVMLRDYKGKLVMTNLTLGTGDEERLTALGNLLLRYIQPEKI